MSATNDAGGMNQVVARFANGSVIKGYTRDFHPERPQFHILQKGASTGIPVKVPELKAVFFVRDLLGNRLHSKNRKFPVADQGPQQGRRIAVLFKDGELLVGNALYVLRGEARFLRDARRSRGEQPARVRRAGRDRAGETRTGCGEARARRTDAEVQVQAARRRLNDTLFLLYRIIRL